MEDPSDDPRHSAHDSADFGDDIPHGMDTLLRVWLQIINEFILTLFAVSLQTFMDSGMSQNAQTSTKSEARPDSLQTQTITTNSRFYDCSTPPSIPSSSVQIPPKALSFPQKPFTARYRRKEKSSVNKLKLPAKDFDARKLMM